MRGNVAFAENLHRAELTVQERADHIAEWVRLTEEKLQSAQVAPIETKRADGRGHRPEGGVNAAVRELGIERTEAQRAVKIASLSDEAKDAARDAGLDDNQSALLDAAKGETPDDQVAGNTPVPTPAPVLLRSTTTGLGLAAERRASAPAAPSPACGVRRGGAVADLFRESVQDWIDTTTTGHLHYNRIAQFAFAPQHLLDQLKVAEDGCRDLGIGPYKETKEQFANEHAMLAALGPRGQDFQPSPKLKAWTVWRLAWDRVATSLHFFESLVHGTLRAFGSPGNPGASPHWIPTDAWIQLRPDSDEPRRLIGGGAVFWNVRVVDPAEIERMAAARAGVAVPQDDARPEPMAREAARPGPPLNIRNAMAQAFTDFLQERSSKGISRLPSIADAHRAVLKRLGVDEGEFGYSRDSFSRAYKDVMKPS